MKRKAEDDLKNEEEEKEQAQEDLEEEERSDVKKEEGEGEDNSPAQPNEEVDEDEKDWPPVVEGLGSPSSSPTHNPPPAKISFQIPRLTEQEYHDLYLKQTIKTQDEIKASHFRFNGWVNYHKETSALAKQHQSTHPSVPYFKKGKHSEKCKFTTEQLELAGQKPLRLVPIRIDAEHDGVKVRDTFTWNLHEDTLTPLVFGETLCEDMGIDRPAPLLLKQVVQSIKDQIDDYLKHAPELLDTRKEDYTQGNDGIDDGEKDLPELRTIIKLDITIDQQCIVDQFEWDIGCARNSPEAFADSLVNELGLMPEFKTAIAHSIREQIQVVSKSLILGNHNFHSSEPLKDNKLAALFLPPVYAGRVQRLGMAWEEFGPILSKASAVEIERMEKDLERESRRKRRQTQRSRRDAPERETSKVTRTPLPLSLTFVAKDPNSKSTNICVHCKTNPKAASEPLLCIQCAAYEAKHGFKPGEDGFEEVGELDDGEDGEYKGKKLDSKNKVNS